MNYFDRLYERNIARESGYLVKCFDEFYEDFEISDELRKVLQSTLCADKTLNELKFEFNTFVTTLY